MATASVTNTFTNGTTADATEVNTNFNDLVTFVNGSVLHLDGSKTMTGNVVMGSNRITGLANGTADTDAANRRQGDVFLIPFQISGTLAVATDQIGRFYLPFAVTFVEVFVRVITAPTGADLQLDINKNGTTLWGTTPANRPIITAAGTTDSVTTFDTTTGADGDYLTVDIDQIGSTVAGADLLGWIWARRTA